MGLCGDKNIQTLEIGIHSYKFLFKYLAYVYPISLVMLQFCFIYLKYFLISDVIFFV